MTPEQQRALGSRISDYLDKECAECQLDGDGMLTMLLTIVFAYAERAGLRPKQDPRPLFERAARIWDMVSRSQRVQIVQELPRKLWGG